jgi:hypothetical protein
LKSLTSVTCDCDSKLPPLRESLFCISSNHNAIPSFSDRTGVPFDPTRLSELSDNHISEIGPIDLRISECPQFGLNAKLLTFPRHRHISPVSQSRHSRDVSKRVGNGIRVSRRCELLSRLSWGEVRPYSDSFHSYRLRVEVLCPNALEVLSNLPEIVRTQHTQQDN